MTSIIEQIQQRKSVRTYTGESLKKNDILSINNYIATLQAPFGAKARIKLIHSDTGSGPVKLGTYGFIGGAGDFLTLICEESEFAEEGAAYLFEQVILHCTGLGLGTCWLGGAFSKKNFNEQLTLRLGEKIRIVSPVGYPSEKQRFIESFIGTSRNHKSRKAFGKLFFDKEFNTPLSSETAGCYNQPLEMVRLAPSANNSQPWRIVLQNDGRADFYCRPPSIGGFSAIDMGIALCHFEQTCRELGIGGHFETLSNNDASTPKDCRYVISWIASTPTA